MSKVVTTSPVSTSIDPKLVRISGLLKMGSESTRCLILMALRDEPLEMLALSDVVGASLAATSHHLGLLRVAGLVTSKRIGHRSGHYLTDKGTTLLAAIDLLSRD